MVRSDWKWRSAQPGPYLLNVRVTPFENVYPMVPNFGAIYREQVTQRSSVEVHKCCN